MTLADASIYSPRAIHDRWAWLPKPNPQATVRLFCFPYAGAGASTFRDWPHSLPANVEVVGIQLPGRENRYTEKKLDRLEDVLKALRNVIAGMSDLPFIFFGHSVGALIAFELTRLLHRDGLRGPRHLVVSGRRAPQSVSADEPMHSMDDAAFLSKLGELNGTPRELLQNAELMKLVMPLLRADFAVAERYVCNDLTPVACPLTAIGGDRDTGVSPNELAAWSAVAGGSFRHEVFPGDHFFIHPSKVQVLALIGAIAGRKASSTQRV